MIDGDWTILSHVIGMVISKRRIIGFWDLQEQENHDGHIPNVPHQCFISSSATNGGAGINQAGTRLLVSKISPMIVNTWDNL